MKTTEEILFDELKYRHKTLQSDWAEGVTKSYRFLQINAVILSMVVIGLNIGILNDLSILLFLSSVCISVSMGIIVTALKSKPVPVTTINKLDADEPTEEILRDLRAAYMCAIEKQMELHDDRMKTIDISIYFFAAGAFFLSAFLLLTIITSWSL